jgi:Fic family protein
MRNSPIGRLVPIAGVHIPTGERYEYWAFAPDSLPQAIEMTPRTQTTIARAEEALAELDRSAREIAAPMQLQSVLDGSYGALAEVAGARNGVPPQLRSSFNQVLAFEEAFAAAGSNSLTPAFVCRLHRLLVSGTSADQGDGGAVRKRQATLGTPGTPITAARYVPPPPGPELHNDFARLLAWATWPPEALPPVVCTAMTYYQLVSLHPFSDGNGRLAALVTVLQLVRYGVLGEPLLVAAPWFTARREALRAELLNLNRGGDWNPWLSFFADGLIECAETTRRRIDQLIAWRAAARDAAAARLSGLGADLVDELICAPILTAPLVAGAHGVTRQTALSALRKLAGAGLMTEVRAGGRLRFYADGVLDVIGDSVGQ